MYLPEEIMSLLKKRASTADYSYINPNFLLLLTEALETYYQMEDTVVDQWIQDMFGV
jgi:hypothetical protein